MLSNFNLVNKYSTNLIFHFESFIIRFTKSNLTFSKYIVKQTVESKIIIKRNKHIIVKINTIVYLNTVCDKLQHGLT